MPRIRDEPPAVRVYTVCDESKYLIVRNVPAYGCGDDLLKLFSSHGDVEECKPMDAEDCEPFTDVYWIKFHQVSKARIAKIKLDDFIFIGNRLQVSYAPHFESLDDTKEKLEGRRTEVLARLNPGRSKVPTVHNPSASQIGQINLNQQWYDSGETEYFSHSNDYPITMVSSDKDYFPSQSMNQTVKLVREKLDKVESSSKHLEAGPAMKKPRVDNRRRI